MCVKNYDTCLCGVLSKYNIREQEYSKVEKWDNKACGLLSFESKRFALS